MIFYYIDCLVEYRDRIIHISWTPLSPPSLTGNGNVSIESLVAGCIHYFPSHAEILLESDKIKPFCGRETNSLDFSIQIKTSLLAVPRTIQSHIADKFISVTNVYWVKAWPGVVLIINGDILEQIVNTVFILFPRL